jgi:hypothetical protein
MSGKTYTEREIILCTYVAMYGYGFFDEKSISKFGDRSRSSIKMKIQNIAAMLDEEKIPRSSDIRPLSGVTTGKCGRRTNWDIVNQLVNMDKYIFEEKCRIIFSESKENLNTPFAIR